MGLFTPGSTFSSIIQSIIGLADMLVGLLAALAVVVFFIGLVRYIKDSGDAKGLQEGKERIVWSLIAIFVLFSLWGILSLMNVAFFGGSTTGAPTNISPSYYNSPTGGVNGDLPAIH